MSWRNELSGPNRDAAAGLIEMFEQFGLGSLAPKIVRYLQQGWGADTIHLALQETNEWKQRFKANEERKRKGLPVLPPNEYLATERAYRQALQASGMPKGMWNNESDFHDFLAKDVSPTEVSERAETARSIANSVDGEQKRALQKRLGLSTSDLAAFYLNPNKALPVLQKQVDITMLEAERRRAGFGYRRSSAEMLYSAGIDAQQAREGYSQISSSLPVLERLGELRGATDDVGLGDLEQEVFGGGEAGADAGRSRRRLASQERARFSGSGGTAGGTLTRDRTFS